MVVDMKSISLFTWLFLILGIIVQLGVYYVTPNTPLALISGLLGICSVVLSAQGSILTFVFGFGQVITYTYLCCNERLYAEIAINIYYFITMIYGVYCWHKRLSKDSLQVQTRRLARKIFPVLGVGVVLLSICTGWFLENYTDDPQPYLDAFTTIPAIVAQILMVMAYREHWYIWLIVDVLATVMWLRAENYCMAAQYAFWCANCIYGYIQWSKSIK